MDLNILDNKLTISSIKKDDIWKYMHAIVKIVFLDPKKFRFFSLTETCEDYTLIMDSELYEDLPHKESLKLADNVWVPLHVSSGAYTSGISSVARSLIIPLADNNISIYCLSSYQTDYILVSESDIDKVISLLSYHKTGDVVPLNKIPQNQSASFRRISHPLSTPDQTYVLTSLGPDYLNSAALSLLTQMFYPKCTSRSSPHTNHYHFFSLTIVDSDVSLVMDTDTLQEFPEDIVFHNLDRWRMVNIGDQPDGLGFAECGIVAQISQPIADRNISEYYISTFYSDHLLVPSSHIKEVHELLHKYKVKDDEESNQT